MRLTVNREIDSANVMPTKEVRLAKRDTGCLYKQLVIYNLTMQTSKRDCIETTTKRSVYIGRIVRIMKRLSTKKNNRFIRSVNIFYFKRQLCE